MSLFHPSNKRLARWFESGDDDEGLEQHVENCERCSDELERIASDEASLPSALAAVLQPTPGLEGRMEQRLGGAMLAREDLRLMLQMFGSGAHTARILLEPPPPDGAQ